MEAADAKKKEAAQKAVEYELPHGNNQGNDVIRPHTNTAIKGIKAHK